MANCGVYAITNTLNGHAYIGSSVNISQRWRAHINSLNKNEHHSDYLQRAWNKYGADSFEFTTILLCDREHKLYFEQVLLDGLKPAYNIALDASAPMQGRHHTEDEVRRMSERQKGKYIGVLNPMFGKHHSEATRALMSLSAKGKRKSEAHKRKIGAAQTGELNHMFGKHPANFGKPMSEELKRKISTAMKGNTNRLGKHCTEETRLKIGLAHKGKNKGNTYALGYKHTEATRLNMSEARMGHAVTDETRRKQSEAAKRQWAERKANEAQMPPILEDVNANSD
jgi:group I intron endonuclease